MMTNEYASRFADMDNACVVSVVGLDGVSSNRLRGELLEHNIRLQVVKNSLMCRAFSDGPLAPLVCALDGPCALVSGGGSAIDVAQQLVLLQKKYPAIELKIGILEGDPELIDVERLAQMKSKTELLREVAMLLASPGRRLAGALAGPAGRIAGCVKAIADKNEGGK